MAKLSFDNIKMRASYGVGLQIGQQLLDTGLQYLQSEALLAGINDVLKGNEPAVPIDELHRSLREVHESANIQRDQHQQKIAVASEKFLEDNLQRDGVRSTESGLQFRVIQQGNGLVPSSYDRVRVHYVGKLTDGTVFASSLQHGEPAEFSISSMIKGWIEALSLMPVGSKWELVIPSCLAYGELSVGTSIPPLSTLVFEVELLKIL